MPKFSQIKTLLKIRNIALIIKILKRIKKKEMKTLQVQLKVRTLDKSTNSFKLFRSNWNKASYLSSFTNPNWLKLDKKIILR